MNPEQHPQSAKCPFTGATSQAFTHREAQHLPGRLQGVDSYAAGRDLLRRGDAVQAGFLAQVVSSIPGSQHPPVLYLEGEEHTEMRRATAKYFTPTAVAGYQPLIARLADDLIAEIARKGEVNLDDLSLKLAVDVAAQVVGLTDSRLPGMNKRIEAFVSGSIDANPATEFKMSPLRDSVMNVNVGLFFMLDVKPAIEARRKQRQDDLISYLLDRDYNDQDILTECITYGTAGMITTREFISMAALHLLKNPELRAQYVHSTEKERHAILHEILRLEPVVTALYRRAESDVSIGGKTYPAGSLIALDVQRANLDPEIMGEDAGQLCPMRDLPRGVQPQGLAFGDGNHRCPGAFLAIKETDVFLRRLLIWNDLEIVKEPSVSYNELVKGYELRGFRIRLGAGISNGAKA